MRSVPRRPAPSRRHAIRSSATAFVRAPIERKRLAIEAAVEVARARIALRRGTFGEGCRRLGNRLDDTEAAIPALGQRETDVARAVASMVRAAGAVVAGPDSCFPQAIAATTMLRRRGIETVSFVGLRSIDQGEIGSHVWVVAGDETVTGAERQALYRPALAFRSGPTTPRQSTGVAAVGSGS